MEDTEKRDYDEEDKTLQTQKKKKKKKKHSKKKNQTIRVEAITESADRAAPIVGYFPSGYDPQRSSAEGGPQVRVFRNPRRNGRVEIVVSPRLDDGSASNVEFVGSSYTGEAANPQVCSYAVGVFDREKNSLRIVPIAANKIFRLEPRVKGQGAEENLPKEETTLESFYEKRNLITNLYGSKKDKTRVRKLSALRNQRDDPNAKESLENQLKGIEVNKEAIMDASAKMNPNIPPHDLSATVPEKAYIIERIINDKEWDHLLDVFWQLESEETSSESLQNKGYPSFVCNRIQKLREIQDEGERRRLSGILSYITHLLKFLEIASLRGKSLSEEHGTYSHHRIPRIIYNKFVGMFVDPESCAMSYDGKNLLINYLLVLTLFADDFKSEPLDIGRDLKMSFLSLKPIYKQLGCHFQLEGKVQVVITLPVPLKIPEIKKRKRAPSVR